MGRFEDEIAQLSPKRLALLCLELKAELDTLKRGPGEPIAVVGMSCRFPGGADSPEALWDLLVRGGDAVSEVPPERWDKESFYDPDPEAPGKMYCWEGGFLQGVDEFDPQFFDISPREAVNIDPQQRLLLEVSWEALERAGFDVARLSGSRTGVFVGISLDDYARIQIWSGDPRSLNAYTGTGSTLSCSAGRVAYALGLQGPTLALDTACSSSLVAVHLACRSLRARECDLALAGGVNLMLSPDSGIFLCKAKALAPDGRCKTFDARADGYSRAEGCGMVALRRLSDATAHGEPVLAVIRGTAVNHDGPSSAFTVPNGQAQKAVITAALEDGGVDPAVVSYVEAHGTGTPLGDPIEVQALAEALHRPHRRHPILLGSVKTNIGHAESAAGAAGLMKLILALQHRQIPPHLHLGQVNPHVHLQDGPFTIATELTAWNPEQGTRVGGVSSFGLSGTNAHVVAEEAPPAPARAAGVERPAHLLALSARHADTLRGWAGRLAEHVAGRPEEALADVCFTANGRSALEWRLCVSAASREGLLEDLGRAARGEPAPAGRAGRVTLADKPSVAFLFTGQGSQYAGMGRELYDTQPTFRRSIDRCDQFLRAHLDRPLLEVLHSAAEGSALDSTLYTQPALFALEYALAALWRSWGVEPSFVMGHSLGEYVAACVAGVMSLPDALALVAERARLMDGLPAAGGMAVAFTDEASVRAAVEPYRAQVAIAALNGPRNVVVSGERRALERVLAELNARNVETKPLNVSHAFHSPLMAPMLEAFARRAAAVEYAPARTRLVSNLTGEVLPAGGDSWPQHWSRHLMAPVRFAEGVAALRRAGCTAFVEVGPHPQLLAMAQQCVDGEGLLWCPTLRRGRGDWEQVLESLGALWVQGMDVDWTGFDRDYPRRRLVLPARPWRRKRYWLDGVGTITLRQVAAGPGAGGPPAHPLLGRRLAQLASLPEEHFWEGEVSLESLPYLADHHMSGVAVAPLSLFLEMARAAAGQAFTERACRVTDLVLHKPLFWPGSEARTVQVRLRSESGQASFHVSSRSAGAASGGWTLHATAKVLLDGAADPVRGAAG